MTPHQRDLVLSLVQVPGRRPAITGAAFLRQLGVADGSAWALDQLRDAMTRRDSDDVELALTAAGVLGATDEYVAPLVSLALEDWHQSHEAVVSMLGRLRPPEAVPALATLTWHVPEYLGWDQSHALARKAVHALGSIEDPSATAALLDARETGPREVSEVAARQLQARSERP